MKIRLVKLLREWIDTECDNHDNCDGCPYGKDDNDCYRHLAETMADHLIKNGVIVPPCKVGDTVWGIRNYRGKKHPQQGIVSEMYFLKDMTLQILVKHVARGKFGKTVFLTREEAEAALKGSLQE